MGGWYWKGLILFLQGAVLCEVGSLRWELVVFVTVHCSIGCLVWLVRTRGLCCVGIVKKVGCMGEWYGVWSE